VPGIQLFVNKDSVEDRVRQLLSERLAHIYGLFGQIPDILEDV